MWHKRKFCGLYLFSTMINAHFGDDYSTTLNVVRIYWYANPGISLYLI